MLETQHLGSKSSAPFNFLSYSKFLNFLQKGRRKVFVFFPEYVSKKILAPWEKTKGRDPL